MELNRESALTGMRKIQAPEPICIDPHFTPQFFAELWGMSPATVTRTRVE